ncbi:MAG: diphosphomevalonate decarboxylase [Legionellales bacterium]|nr:diphosphomevalonate decarboxylase [Legionellales bacterium]
MKWFAKAPSNIALIKYMGKSRQETNTPTNTSISYTLNHLMSYVEVELNPNSEQDVWHPLAQNNCKAISLNSKAKTKFLNHLSLIKERFNVNENFIVSSCNNFPHSTGIASSASSFAALTKCAINAMCSIKNIPLPSINDMAKISKLGSGSSCRSFFSPWAIWKENTISNIAFPYDDLIHQIIIVSDTPKIVSSSQAHVMVQSSPLFQQRLDKIEERANNLISQINNQNWFNIYQIVKEEFLEMHKLFETSIPSFSFMSESSKKIIDDVECLWETRKDGPLITMDAGPNVHLLYRKDQTNIANEFYNNYRKTYEIL